MRWSRRRLLRRAAGAAGLACLGAPALRAGGVEPSATLRLGLIGCGGRGRELLQVFDGFADVHVAALSDVNAPRMDEASKVIPRSRDREAPGRVADYRRILERRDIDLVVIATCEHWHGLPFLDAASAGKHIYVEKPLSHTVAEGRLMVEAARKSGIVAVMGTQQRAGEHFQKAVALVRSGRLGKVAQVECWNYSDITRKRGGRPPDVPPPSSLDWDRWLGPAPAVPFNPLRLAYSWWFDYGGGMMTNWAVHHLDVVLWAMGASAPRSATCAGGLLVTDTASEAPDSIEAAWEFPGPSGGEPGDGPAGPGSCPWTLRYNYCGFNDFHRFRSRLHNHGILFTGSRAALVLDRQGYEIYENGSSMKPVESEGKTPQDGPWQRHFIDCVKGGKTPAVTLEESHRATVCCLLGNIAYHTRRRIAWDPGKEEIPGDPEAARMLVRPRRKGYELVGR